MQPVIPRPTVIFNCILICILVQANCGSTHQSQVITGDYIPIGSVGAVLVYHKETPDLNGKIWTMFYDIPLNRWKFDYVNSLLSVGGTIHGATIQPLDLTLPGKDCSRV